MEDLVYIDESGIEQNIYKAECWGKKGIKVIGERSGSRKVRINMIAALNSKVIKAPIYFYGSTDTEVICYWLEHHLIPELKAGQTVILDNAAFHKSIRVKELIEKVGCKLLYLPPYSPDLNPIENYWAVVKRRIKKFRAKFDNIVDAVHFVLGLTYIQ